LSCEKSERVIITGLTMILLYGLAVYAFLGVVIGVVFAIFGVSQVIPHTATMTLGARILILPGAAALWPYVLVRWLKSRGAP
jgi:hypothetical protein